MKLCYRGVEYDQSFPSLEVTERDILGRYRGRTLQFSYVRHLPIPQPVADLKFRGVSYRTNTHGSVEPAAQAEVSREAEATTTTFNAMAAARRQLLQEASRIHQDNIRRSLQRRMAVARAQGNESLLRQLEDEMHQFA